MSTWSVDTSQDDALAARLGEVGAELMDGLDKATRDAGTQMRDRWRANAKRTAGRHGKWYPGTIQAATRGGETWVESTIEPRAGRRQAGMAAGFEYGSQNQPPHLDAAKAFPGVDRDWRSACDTALSRALEML